MIIFCSWYGTWYCKSWIFVKLYVCDHVIFGMWTIFCGMFMCPSHLLFEEVAYKWIYCHLVDDAIKTLYYKHKQLAPWTCITAAGHCLGGRGGDHSHAPPSLGVVITLLIIVVWPLCFFFAIPLCAPPSSQLHHCWSAQPSPSVQPLHFGFTAPVQSGSSTFGLLRSSVYTTYCNWLWILEIWLDLNQGSLALSASAQTAEPQISNYMCAGTYIWLLTCGFCNQHRAGRRQVWRCGVAVVFPCSCSQQVCIETHLTKSF